MINKIHCCDYKTLFPKIPSESIDLVLTDPPFGINFSNQYTHSQHEVLEGDSEPFHYTFLAEQSFRVLKNNTAIFAFTGWSEYPKHYNEIASNGFTIKEPLIVQKRPSGTHDLYGSFQSNSDWIIFGHKGRFTFRPTELLKNKRAGTVPNKGRSPVKEYKTRFPSCWFGEEFPWASENPSFQKKFNCFHPTIKTVDVMEWIIRMSTDEGGTVLDPFCGSGSVAMAAKRSGRHYICCDVSEKFCKYAERRLSEDWY